MDLIEIKRMLEAKPFRPPRLLSNNHTQTLLGYAHPRRFQMRELQGDEARLFRVASDARVLAHCRWQTGERRKRPTLLLVHGLEGSSRSIYMLGAAAKAFRAGFNVVRLNIRTCGNTEHLTSTLYHSGMSEDLHRIIDELIEQDRVETIFLTGFSLGGNMSLKLAGEYGANFPVELRGVCAISPSIDLAASAAAIEQSSNWLYNQRFISSLKKRMRRVQRLYPNLYNAKELAFVRTVRHFDERYTAVYNGFESAEDYYARSSALQFIERIRVPTLIIHAQDDPFVPFDSFRASAIVNNPAVILLAPQNGGHVGFVSASNHFINEDRFWAENRMIEFFQSLLDLGSRRWETGDGK